MYVGGRVIQSAIQPPSDVYGQKFGLGVAYACSKVIFAHHFDERVGLEEAGGTMSSSFRSIDWEM